ncbi:MAG: CHAP domain-containing protein [Brevinemataceae bacterium]
MKKLLSTLMLIYTGIFILTTQIFANDSELFYQKLLYYAPKTIGLTAFPSINNTKYLGDCSGFIAFLFHLAGLNFKKLYGIGSNGVSAIWDGLEKQGFIINTNILQPGDIVFFDNTYDKNKNNKWDDELSHIGVVESVDQHHTITYLHYGSKGVTRSKMNLHYPQIKSKKIDNELYYFNEILRNKTLSEQLPEHNYLSGSLYRGAARLILKKRIK